jgi:hypothetical protein
MKKLLLGIVLLAALVGVVYLQSERAEQQRAKIAEEGFRAGLTDGEELRAQVDSLTGVVEHQDDALAESVAVREDIYAGEIDSLTDQIQAQEVKIADLSNKLEQEATTSRVAAQNTTAVPNKQHLEILNYYKKAVIGLPGDLSSYERRVALSEIRNETAEKFSITVSRLNSIRKEHDLEY